MVNSNRLVLNHHQRIVEKPKITKSNGMIIGGEKKATRELAAAPSIPLTGTSKAWATLHPGGVFSSNTRGSSVWMKPKSGALEMACVLAGCGFVCRTLRATE
ncbi:uncharacterized protein BDCG_08865 [Blastomyces dermatitidis ER-3]|uniref:Uncharacterized protein n=1 Tax=Ajellomyces dermatitidis (strain ER-3 / ATCC MYA-2586) TaxID=559297 RepID=A0ABP2EQE3_AJEDR|nr:uncharacterized protein BDCG_08865 [Blastomyces dermatitidis ER-3]EEQ85596.1 hypothetical protein BDCG_08865 [Blastomyces dermatitidis ER-3]